MPHSITYVQLIKRVSRVISINISKFWHCKMFKLKTSDPMLLIPIMPDDDVDDFVEQMISRANLKILLCIT